MNNIQKIQGAINLALQDMNYPLAIVFEGRDGAGKTGAIRQATEYLPFSKYRIIHSRMPSKTAMKSWLEYWSHQLPTQAGQVYLFDRSWYSRALCQRINDWASKKQVNYFLNAVNSFEETRKPKILKLWLSIDQETQQHRLTRRIGCPLRGWKFSENDKNALVTYDEMTFAKYEMMSYSKNWVEIDFNDKAQGEMNLLLQIYKFIIRENSYENY